MMPRHWTVRLSYLGKRKDGTHSDWRANATFGVLAETIAQAIEEATNNLVEAGAKDIFVFSANDRGVIDLIHGEREYMSLLRSQRKGLADA